MTETTSKVYDLIYPSPSTLKEITSIALAFELWRQEIIKYCRSNTSNLSGLKLDLKNAIPEVPTIIFDLLKECTTKCESSILEWLMYHSDLYNQSNATDFLRKFHDFAYDWNGTIHYVRTAKRIILCEQISEKEKFKLACKYCFEDDIMRIWPSVSSKIHLNSIDVDRPSILYYWICRLKNELDKISNEDDQSIDEMMLDKCDSENWSSVEYFWQRIPAERQLQKAMDLSMSNWEPLARFILPKLNEHQLDILIAARGCDLINALFMQCLDKAYVLPTWMFIRNKIEESSFISFIERLHHEETNYMIAKERLSPKDEASICCEIWKTAPQKFKESALVKILANGELFERQCIRPLQPREMRFLITVLLDASIEQRKEFLCKNWRRVITGGARVEDLCGIIKVCIENEKEIEEFKRNIMGKYENIDFHCTNLMSCGYFKELNELLTFCHPDMSTRKKFQQKLLRDKFLGEHSILNATNFGRIESLNEFIDSAFDNIDQATDFKNQFFSAPATKNCLFESVRLGYFISLMEFMNTFMLADQNLEHLKEQIFDSLKSHLIGGSIWQFDADHLQKILIWCLGNSEKVEEFKRSLPVDDIFRNMIRTKLSSRDNETDVVKYPRHLDDFPRWYFDSFKEVENFKKRFSNELKFFRQ